MEGGLEVCLHDTCSTLLLKGIGTFILVKGTFNAFLALSGPRCMAKRCFKKLHNQR